MHVRALHSLGDGPVDAILQTPSVSMIVHLYGEQA